MFPCRSRLWTVKELTQEDTVPLRPHALQRIPGFGKGPGSLLCGPRCILLLWEGRSHLCSSSSNFLPWWTHWIFASFISCFSHKCIFIATYTPYPRHRNKFIVSDNWIIRKYCTCVSCSEGTSALCSRVDEPRGYYVKWNKLFIDRCYGIDVLYLFLLPLLTM